MSKDDEPAEGGELPPWTPEQDQRRERFLEKAEKFMEEATKPHPPGMIGEVHYYHVRFSVHKIKNGFLIGDDSMGPAGEQSTFLATEEEGIKLFKEWLAKLNAPRPPGYGAM